MRGVLNRAILKHQRLAAAWALLFGTPVLTQREYEQIVEAMAAALEREPGPDLDALHGLMRKGELRQGLDGSWTWSRRLLLRIIVRGQ